MNIRTIATLVAAVFLGLIAVLLVRGYLSSAQRPVQQAQALATKPVVVASQPIERGVALEPQLLKVVNYPADAVPADAFASVSQVSGPTSPGRLALRSLAANEPILGASISGPGGKLNLSTVVAPGMRAISLRSGDVAGVAGFVLPGDKVDIYLTRAVGDKDRPTTVTQVLAQDVLVLGVDQISSQETDKPVVARAVTVQVTPDQAQMIQLAQAVGAVSFALRHVADDAPLGRRFTTVSDLGFTPRPANAPVVRRPKDVLDVRVTRGLETTAYTVGSR
jgi:pilus assembly protein CpaB